MYVVNLHHRNGNINKSQWTISEADEIRCFNSARTQGWVLGDKAWGLHVVKQKPAWLGVTQDRMTQLFMAKFVSNSGSSDWHGYPADYRKNNHDIPEEEILRKWLSHSGLSAAKIRKIAKGQPCNL